MADETQPAPRAEKPAGDPKPAPKKAPKAAAPKKDGAEGAPAEKPVKTEASAPAAGAPTAGGEGKDAGAPKTAQQTIAEILGDETGVIKVRKAKGSKNVTTGQAYVTATFNNTFVTITDLKGQVVSWSSAGKCGFRGSRKSTAYAAQVVAQDAARNGMAHGLKEITIYVKGPGLGRDSAIRALQAVGLEILSIVDVTPIPHNGCRPRKRRRV
jgi:small subunit ribosomal protein S11